MPKKLAPNLMNIMKIGKILKSEKFMIILIKIWTEKQTLSLIFQI